jgi:fructose-1,6-bisphosphatase
VPQLSKESHSKGTQTDDNGCSNGCTSKYIDNIVTGQDCSRAKENNLDNNSTSTLSKDLDVCVAETDECRSKEVTRLQMLVSSEEDVGWCANSVLGTDPVTGQSVMMEYLSLASAVSVTENRALDSIGGTSDGENCDGHDSEDVHVQSELEDNL